MFFQWWKITTNKEWWIFLCHLPFSNLLSPSTVLTGETVFVRKNRRSKHFINSQNSTYWLHKFHMCHNIYLYKWVNRNTFTCSLESRAVAHLAFSVFIQIWVISFWFNFIDLNSLFIIFTNCYQKVQFLPYKAIWQSLPFNAYFITSLILTGLSFQRCQQGVLFNLRTSSL